MNAVHSLAGSLSRFASVLEWRLLSMRLIDRYICRQVFSHALLGLGIFSFVFFVPQLVRLMDLVVRHSASWATLGILFLCTLPGILSFTLPMGVLVGVLIALGRMSADSELIAMSALGLGRRRLLVPIGILAVGATLITFCMTLWLGPLSVRTFRNLEERLRTGQASFQVAPRVFDERFPHFVLYVNDIDSAATRWKGVFLAGTDAKDVSRLTLAEEAIVITAVRASWSYTCAMEASTNSRSTSQATIHSLPSPNATCPSKLAASKPGPLPSHPYRAARCVLCFASAAPAHATPASKFSAACRFLLLVFRLLSLPCPWEHDRGAEDVPLGF
jgi:lipopolysaccharide export LptBFGC system permease protein LptF